MQQMPQQTATGQAMPVGAPAQSNKGGLGALAAQRQQGGQADPRLMAMMQAMGGNRPQPAMPMGQQAASQAAQMQVMQQQMGQRVDQFGRPSATGQFAFDPGQQQRIAQAGLTPDQLAQMTPDQRAQLQPLAPVDINPMTGLPIDSQMQSRIMAQQAAANQAMQQMQGGIPAQRPLPVGAGGKGTGMPPPGMVNPPRPMPLPPGLNRPMPMPLPPGVNRPMPMPMPPGSMVNPPRPISPKPVPQPVRPTPKPMNPRFNQIMPFLR